jgi:dTDP-glucose 4,6-dehydratase
MARLLVTGGAGFIGSNFVHYWLDRHPGGRIVVLDSLTYAGCLSNLASVRQRPELRFVQASVCDTAAVEAVMREECLDTVVHFAAESHVDRSIHGPDAFIETNVIGTHSLLKAARNLWIRDGAAVNACRFHHVSTDEVYGSLGPNDSGFNERTPYAPNSPYAASKACSDHLVRAYHKTYGLPATISNCTNNYGPYQFPEKLIPLTIINILHGRDLPIYGDGRNVRDWLHVSDHCRGIDLVLSNGRAGEVYNIGGASECENIEIVRMLCSLADEAFREDPQLRLRFPRSPCASGLPAASLIRFVRDRLGHDRRYAIDSRKISRELGYNPDITMCRGIGDVFDWYLQNEAWWSELVDGRLREWVQVHYGSANTREPIAAS